MSVNISNCSFIVNNYNNSNANNPNNNNNSSEMTDNTTNSSNNLNSNKNNNNNYKISVEENRIHIKTKGQRFDWMRFPHLVKLIHEAVLLKGFSFRKAADYCNYNYYEIFNDQAISFATIQGWYTKNPALGVKNT